MLLAKYFLCVVNLFGVPHVFPKTSLHSRFPLQTAAATDSDPPIQRPIAMVTGEEGVHDAASCNLMHRQEAQQAKSGGLVYLCSLCEINSIIHDITQIFIIIYDIKYWCRWLICSLYLISFSIPNDLEMWISSLCPLVSFFWYKVWFSQTLIRNQLWWEGAQNKRAGWGRVCHVICVTKPQDVTTHHAVRH